MGSNVLADQGLSIRAEGQLVIEATQESMSTSQFREERRSGLMGSGGIGVTLGRQPQSVDGRVQQRTASASTVDQ